jgi:lysyl-tRNA synthetase class 2
MNQSLSGMFIREKMVAEIRAFFAQRQFHEVITPVLNRALPLEPTLYSFSTQWEASQKKEQLYLATSPESSLKKMMAQGLGNCFAIGKSFRNLEGNGPLHNPEFLMLEWYRKQADYQRIMSDTEELVRSLVIAQNKSSILSYQSMEIDVNHKWPTLSLEDLFQENVGISLAEVCQNSEQLFQCAQKKNYHVTGASWEQVFNQLYLNEVEQHLPKEPFFLIDFPVRISPLCAPRADKPYLAQRFEFFLFGIELANGNTEQTDAHVVKTFFADELRDRQGAGQKVAPIDQEFLDALEILKREKLAGVGLGIDRLAMILANETELRAVEPFCL